MRPHRWQPTGLPHPGDSPGKNTGLGWHVVLSSAWKWKVKVKSLSHIWLLATPWTAAYQAPLSMGFTRQKYWSGLPLVLKVKNLPTNTGDTRDVAWFLGWAEMANHSSIFAWRMDRATWKSTVHVGAKSQTWMKWLSRHTCTCITESHCCTTETTTTLLITPRQNKKFKKSLGT